MRFFGLLKSENSGGAVRLSALGHPDNAENVFYNPDSRTCEYPPGFRDLKYIGPTIDMVPCLGPDGKPAVRRALVARMQAATGAPDEANASMDSCIPYKSLRDGCNRDAARAHESLLQYYDEAYRGEKEPSYRKPAPGAPNNQTPGVRPLHARLNAGATV